MAQTQETDRTALERTPLHALHESLGARMVPFAGYEMPVQYGDGIMAEHRHTRAGAGLFDVSHMGQAWLTAPSGVGGLLERLVPGDIAGLAEGRMRYTQLTNREGGIIDDLMVARMPAKGGRERLFMVVNAARKTVDLPHIATMLKGEAALEPWETRALIALQGPAAATVLARHFPEIDGMVFMTAREIDRDAGTVVISRSGYTGEDGFEISLPAAMAEGVARDLLAHDEVAPVGLGARDSLRLEAGLCLYGDDIDESTSPVEAGLRWSIGKRRREEGGFPGAERILREIAEGPARRLVGIRPEGRAPARHGTVIRSADGAEIGTVTSGGFGPTVEGPVAMGYVAAGHAAPGTDISLVVRGKALAAQVVKLPFVPHRYVKQN